MEEPKTAVSPILEFIGVPYWWLMADDWLLLYPCQVKHLQRFIDSQSVTDHSIGNMRNSVGSKTEPWPVTQQKMEEPKTAVSIDTSRDSCFTLIRVHQCSILTVNARWQVASISSPSETECSIGKIRNLYTVPSVVSKTEPWPVTKQKLKEPKTAVSPLLEFHQSAVLMVDAGWLVASISSPSEPLEIQQTLAEAYWQSKHHRALHRQHEEFVHCTQCRE